MNLPEAEAVEESRNIEDLLWKISQMRKLLASDPEVVDSRFPRLQRFIETPRSRIARWKDGGEQDWDGQDTLETANICVLTRPKEIKVVEIRRRSQDSTSGFSLADTLVSQSADQMIRDSDFRRDHKDLDHDVEVLLERAGTEQDRLRNWINDMTDAMSRLKRKRKFGGKQNAERFGEDDEDDIDSRFEQPETIHSNMTGWYGGQTESVQHLPSTARRRISAKPNPRWLAFGKSLRRTEN